MAFYKVVIISLGILLAFLGKSSTKLIGGYYSYTCPHLQDVVQNVLKSELKKEARMLASILRLHFHDCLVNGCDGSILLRDTKHVMGEMGARPNLNSVRGFEVIENIKTRVEKECKAGVVSCADILTLAARESVVLLGGPNWDLAFGRRDGFVTQNSKLAANNDIPNPFMNINALKKKFSEFSFDTTDLVALSGAHTIGQARCTNFRFRIYNETNTINKKFAAKMQATCPKVSSRDHDDVLGPLDNQTPLYFDNSYYKNLIAKEGLLHSDQEMHNQDKVTAGIVNKYSRDQAAFFADFSKAMTKMSLLNPLMGNKGQIRKICSKMN